MAKNLLICSLGNPGPKYYRTRHSIGHVLVDKLIRDGGQELLIRKAGLSGELHEGISVLNDTLTSHRIALFKPDTYMNVSGSAVAKAWTWAKKEYGNSAKLVVLHDELDLPVGKMRAAIGGSARGHNGLKSVASFIRPEDVLKVGIGIGRPESRVPEHVANFVLGKVVLTELNIINDVVYPRLWAYLADLENGVIEK
ncbi:peptidyl-tRNA hydrolase [Lipomyces arxii]|uniref:peptidyl-tRNA hydrolase n=1 Tax=Lipomyces arxii TaxID=56418 RepID=UPI0034CEA1A0